jgi:uncharacterized iron-regulated protein
MSIKIQTGNPMQGVAEVAANTENQTVGSEAVSASVASETADPVTRIAMDLVEGRIDSSQAVDALIEQTMSVEMVASAPESLREEVAAVLRDAIATDPYLIGLARQLD